MRIVSKTFQILVFFSIVLWPTINSATEMDYIKSICARCHGFSGMAMSDIMPNLAGQREKYLVKQLHDFRKSASISTNKEDELTDIGGKRRHPIMTTITTRLTDGQISELSQHYASQPCRSKSKTSSTKPIPKATVCLTCHDESGSKHEPWVPKLSGQNKLYLLNQIYALRASNRPKNMKGKGLRSHPLMEEKVADLSEIEIADLATYFATRSCK